MEKRQNVTLNCWKLIAALLIMGHHAAQIGQKGDYVFHGAYVYTEFFFMVSGYFFIKSLEEGKTRGIMDYAKKVWLKLFPYTAIVISIYYFMIGLLSGSVKQCLKIWILWPLEIFYLNELHIAFPQLGQLWYVAAMLFVIPFISWLFLKDRELFKIFIWMVPVIWYGYCYTTWGQLGHRGVFIDLIRALSNLLLGGVAYYISNRISDCKCIGRHKWIGTVIGWGAFIITIVLTYKHYWTEYDIYCIFYFLAALIFVQSKSFVDIKYGKLNMLSGLSMSIYVTHIPVGRLVQRFSPSTVTVAQKYILYYFITIICAIVLLISVEYIKGLNIKIS